MVQSHTARWKENEVRLRKSMDAIQLPTCILHG
jgi:hypothetical protein